MLVVIICMVASMIFGAGMMYIIMDIWYLEKKVRRLKYKIKKMKENEEPEVIKVIDVTPSEE